MSILCNYVQEFNIIDFYFHLQNNQQEGKGKSGIVSAYNS